MARGTRVNGKVALVTGGARGIGAAVAERFAAEGARLVILDKEGAEAGQMAERLAGQGSEALGIGADVSQRTDMTSAVARAVERFGRLDILVASAGLMGRKPFLETTDEHWQRLLSVNLTGVFLASQEAARQMVRQGGGGAIVAIASISGVIGGNGRAAYGATKAGVINLTETMAIELARHGIRANAIAPGPIKTRPEQGADISDAVRARMPMRRFGRAEEVANVALFLASDEASFVTGQTYRVDGGFSTSGMPDA